MDNSLHVGVDLLQVVRKVRQWHIAVESQTSSHECLRVYDNVSHNWWSEWLIRKWLSESLGQWGPWVVIWESEEMWSLEQIISEATAMWSITDCLGKFCSWLVFSESRAIWSLISCLRVLGKVVHAKLFESYGNVIYCCIFVNFGQCSPLLVVLEARAI